KPELRPQALAQDKPTLEFLSGLAAMQRARELFLCELPEQAATEFRYAQRDLSVEQRAQAARLAASWGWHEQAVLLLSELLLWDDLWLRFPAPYDAEIEAAARDSGLSANWLYAVLRTESLYNPRAVSRSDALGLMQLRLSAAREVARRAKLSRPARDDLFKPQVNTALAARYLRELHERFGRRFIFTLAAYNAGPQRLPGWRPASEVPGDVWVENVPYNETRTYIQRALSSLVMIGWRRGGEPAPILPLLSPVAPAGEDAP
ncbi:MAG: transglycosylase SLT domain-containing protein, partial [Hydrocarboniphaga effusa]|nr:transglycosylase SLT domain-containing protein [Hydrocarboniphaga effusa]